MARVEPLSTAEVEELLAHDAWASRNQLEGASVKTDYEIWNEEMAKVAARKARPAPSAPVLELLFAAAVVFAAAWAMMLVWSAQ